MREMDYPVRIQKVIRKYACVVDGEVTMINHDIAILLMEIDRLQAVNAELRAQYVDMSGKSLDFRNSSQSG